MPGKLQQFLSKSDLNTTGILYFSPIISKFSKFFLYPILNSAFFWFQDFAEFPLKVNTGEGLAATGQLPETDSENSEAENENEMQRR
jgi:hypothetical protein